MTTETTEEGEVLDEYQLILTMLTSYSLHSIIRKHNLAKGKPKREQCAILITEAAIPYQELQNELEQQKRVQEYNHKRSKEKRTLELAQFKKGDHVYWIDHVGGVSHRFGKITSIGKRYIMAMEVKQQVTHEVYNDGLGNKYHVEPLWDQIDPHAYLNKTRLESNQPRLFDITKVYENWQSYG